MISLRQVEVEYTTAAGPVLVLRGIDFSLEKGAASAVVGPSGSGKTTFLNVIGAMMPVTSGQVVVAGQDLTTLSADEAAMFRNQKIGFVFQQHYLLPQLNVVENVLVPRLAGGWKESEEMTRERADFLLERVGLSHRINHRPSQLSGGEKQRVAVARALINQPELILADEPTGALDQDTGERVTELLLEMKEEAKAALVVVTHDERLAGKVGNLLKLC